MCVCKSIPITILSFQSSNFLLRLGRIRVELLADRRTHVLNQYLAAKR